MARSKTTLLLAILLLAGCASSQRLMLAPARAPIDPADVRLYRSVPPGAMDIAQLEASSSLGFGTRGQDDAVIARLRREAAAIGANGLVILGHGQSRSPVGVSVGGASYGRHTAVGVGVGIPTARRNAAAVAIFVPSETGERPGSD